MATHQPGELVFAVFDPRQQLQNFIPDGYLGEYAANGQRAAQLAEFVAGQVRDRLGDGSTTPVRTPRIVLLVDDYDILVATGNQPLRPLAGYLPSGADVGLYALVTGRTSGAAVSVHDPFIAGLRAAGSPVILFSGDRSEGVIANGERPIPLVTGRARILRPSRPPIVLQTFHHEGQIQQEASARGPAVSYDFHLICGDDPRLGRFSQASEQFENKFTLAAVEGSESLVLAFNGEDLALLSAPHRVPVEELRRIFGEQAAGQLPDGGWVAEVNCPADKDTAEAVRQFLMITVIGTRGLVIDPQSNELINADPDAADRDPDA